MEANSHYHRNKSLKKIKITTGKDELEKNKTKHGSKGKNKRKATRTKA